MAFVDITLLEGVYLLTAPVLWRRYSGGLSVQQKPYQVVGRVVSVQKTTYYGIACSGPKTTTVQTNYTTIFTLEYVLYDLNLQIHWRSVCF